MASAAEAEYGEPFLNSRLSFPLRMALKDLNHHQPPLPSSQTMQQLKDLHMKN